MSSLNDQDLSAVVFGVDKEKFSVEAFRPAWLFEIAATPEGFSIVDKPGFLGKLFGIGRPKGTQYICVCETTKPEVFKNVELCWSEGTSDLDLDFLATFRIRIESNEQAQALAMFVSGAEGCSKELVKKIDSSLHNAMTSFLAECGESMSLLDHFYNETGVPGMSENLNSRVSKHITKKLRGASFGIGFKIKDLPPQEILVTSSPQFDLKGSGKPWSMTTKAKLRLTNYQNYKKSGMQSADTVIASMKQAMTVSVEAHLYGKEFFELVDQFFPGQNDEVDTSIKSAIEKDIAEKAKHLGFEVKLFHALPDVPPLKLVEGIRFELRPKDHGFKTQDSDSIVRIEMVADAKAIEFTKLKQLFTPTDAGVTDKLTDEAHKNIQDTLRKINNMQFNLGFEEKVKPLIESNLTTLFSDRYGLKLDITSLNPLQTDDMERLEMLCARRKQIKLSFSPQADGGSGDVVHYSCTFRVIGFAPNGWAEFTRQDHGFRKNSKFRERIAVDRSAPELQLKNEAIDRELGEIASNISDNVQEAFSKIPGLANLTRTWEESKDIRARLEDFANKHVEDEFGVLVAITGFLRDDTDIERLNQDARKHRQEAYSLEKENELKALQNRHERDEQLGNKIHEEQLADISIELDDDEVRDIRDRLEAPTTSTADLEKEMKSASRIKGGPKTKKLPEP